MKEKKFEQVSDKELENFKMKSEKTIYNIISCIGYILIIMLILLVKPANIYYNAIDFILVIALFIIEVKIYLQLRKIKNKKVKKS